MGAQAEAARAEAATAEAATAEGATAEGTRPEGAAHGILIASQDGRHLYRRLGWHPVADVLIAAAPDA